MLGEPTLATRCLAGNKLRCPELDPAPPSRGLWWHRSVSVGLARILGFPVLLLPNSHGLTIPGPRAIQRVPFRFHPCCVPVLFCDQIVSLPRHGLVVAGLWVTPVLAWSKLVASSHPLLARRVLRWALLAADLWPEKQEKKKKRKKGNLNPPLVPIR